MAVRISFDRGTLDLENLGHTGDVVLPGVLWDPRTRSTRAPAYRFGEIVNVLASAGVEAECAITWPEPRGQFIELELRPYQQAALDCWEVAGEG